MEKEELNAYVKSRIKSGVKPTEVLYDIIDNRLMEDTGPSFLMLLFVEIFDLSLSDTNCILYWYPRKGRRSRNPHAMNDEETDECLMEVIEKSRREWDS